MTDITELQTDEGKLFLCVVLDLFNKLVVGWSMHHRQDRQMVIRAIEMAVWQRQGTGLVILHSVRGSQFRSGDYQRFLKRNTLISSMSAVGHCGTTRPAKASLECSSVKESTIGAIGRKTKSEPRYSITLKGSITLECGVGSQGRIRSFPPF